MSSKWYPRMMNRIMFRLAKKGKMILGICGGYQMLGKEILDPHHLESKREKIQGLGLLNVITILKSNKITSQVKAQLIEKKFFYTQEEISGYEIHMGITKLLRGVRPWLKIIKRLSQSVNIEDGAIDKEGKIMGTYIHGLFDNYHFRRCFINYLRKRKRVSSYHPQTEISAIKQRNREYDKLAELVRDNLDMGKIYQILSNSS